MNKAYLVGHITVKDQEKWTEYRNRVPATLEPWGAELLFRGRLCSVLSGQHDHTDTVVIRFPDLGALNSWYFSPAYQSLIPLRKEAAEIDSEIATRVKLFLYRVPEELYDFACDPDAKKNLINDPAYKKQLKQMRKDLLSWMEKTKDPLKSVFVNYLNTQKG